jgi:hypothetical protein
LQPGIELKLTVFPKFPEFFKTAKRALNDPSLWHHFKSVKLIMLGNCDLRSKYFSNPVRKRLACIGAIGKKIDHRQQQFFVMDKSIQCPFLSVTPAVVTAMAWGKPCVSTAIWRLIPDISLTAS